MKLKGNVVELEEPENCNFLFPPSSIKYCFFFFDPTMIIRRGFELLTKIFRTLQQRASKGHPHCASGFSRDVSQDSAIIFPWVTIESFRGPLQCVSTHRHREFPGSWQCVSTRYHAVQWNSVKEFPRILTAQEYLQHASGRSSRKPSGNLQQSFRGGEQQSCGADLQG